LTAGAVCGAAVRPEAPAQIPVAGWGTDGRLPDQARRPVPTGCLSAGGTL